MAEAAGLAYERHGGGAPSPERPPLILIHGAGGTRWHWPPEIRRLPGRTVFAIDLPGHGASSGAGHDSIAAYQADIVDWLDALGLERAVWVGHSMGGAVALMAALEAPARVAGLVLVASGARLRVHPAILEKTAEGARFLDAVDEVTGWAFSPQTSGRLVAQARKRMEKNRPETLHGDFVACDAFDVVGRVGQVAAPTLAIVGRDDRLTPEKYARWLEEEVRGARLEVIEAAGHMVMLEQPRAVAQAIERFLADGRHGGGQGPGG